MDIILTIPDAQIPRIVDAIAIRFGFVAGQGQTKNQFAKAQLIKWLKDNVGFQEAQTAADVAYKASVADVNTINIT